MSDSISYVTTDSQLNFLWFCLDPKPLKQMLLAKMLPQVCFGQAEFCLSSTFHGEPLHGTPPLPCAILLFEPGLIVKTPSGFLPLPVDLATLLALLL